MKTGLKVLIIIIIAVFAVVVVRSAVLNYSYQKQLRANIENSNNSIGNNSANNDEMIRQQIDFNNEAHQRGIDALTD